MLQGFALLNQGRGGGPAPCQLSGPDETQVGAGLLGIEHPFLGPEKTLSILPQPKFCRRPKSAVPESQLSSQRRIDLLRSIYQSNGGEDVRMISNRPISAAAFVRGTKGTGTNRYRPVASSLHFSPHPRPVVKQSYLPASSAYVAPTAADEQAASSQITVMTQIHEEDGEFLHDALQRQCSMCISQLNLYRIDFPSSSKSDIPSKYAGRNVYADVSKEPQKQAAVICKKLTRPISRPTSKTQLLTVTEDSGEEYGRFEKFPACIIQSSVAKIIHYALPPTP